MSTNNLNTYNIYARKGIVDPKHFIGYVNEARVAYPEDNDGNILYAYYLEEDDGYCPTLVRDLDDVINYLVSKDYIDINLVEENFHTQ